MKFNVMYILKYDNKRILTKNYTDRESARKITL